jgi:hypothetical protein
MFQVKVIIFDYLLACFTASTCLISFSIVLFKIRIDSYQTPMKESILTLKISAVAKKFELFFVLALLQFVLVSYFNLLKFSFIR